MAENMVDIGPDIWGNAVKPGNINFLYKSYAGATGLIKSQIFQNIYRALVNTSAPAGSKNNNMFEEIQTLLRKKGFSKGKSPLGIIDVKDLTGLDEAIRASVAQNAQLITFLNVTDGSSGTPKQPNRSTTYNKQVSTALQLKDITEARLELGNANFIAFGTGVSEDTAKNFDKLWNEEVIKQTAALSTQYVTSQQPIYDKTSKPTIDAKTKKQKIDKFGNKVYSKTIKDQLGNTTYNSVTNSTSTTPGKFTEEEQKQFLSDYIIKNNPSTKWDIKTLGGQAKTTYDDLIATISANYGATQDLSTLGPVISEILRNSDPKVSAEVIKKFKDDQRKAAGIKYMGVAEYTNAGENANKYIAPLMKTASDYLETNVAIDDPIMKKFLNFQGSDGKYRLPNDYEIEQEVKKDSRYQKTSRAKNDVVNLFQSLKDQIGR